MNRTELRQLFAFDRWATRRCLAALRSLDEASVELRDLLWHTLTATDNWLSRIDGSEPFEPLQWGDPHTLDDLDRYAARIEAESAAFADAIEDTRFAEPFDYRNSSGVPFTNVVADVLQHVALHGVEHRAQLMWEVGKLGGATSELEYAWFLRDPPADA
jgi:uncharacterized damage-inducible protein DinB